MTDAEKIKELREALELAWEELRWFADEHRCCSLSDTTVETIKKALAPEQ